MRVAEDDEADSDEFFDGLPEADSDAIRDALLRELRQIVADTALRNTGSANPQSHAHLADIAETDMQHADVEELVFALGAFGFEAEVAIDEAFPEGVDERIDVHVIPRSKISAAGAGNGSSVTLPD